MANDLDQLFQSAADQYGLPVGFIKAIAQQETGTNPNSRDSYQGAQGLMQMLPQTAAAMGAQNPRDPAQAIPAAARYLREGLDATGSLSGAAAYYHGGPDRKQWGPKTQNYVQSVGSIFSKMPQPQGVEPRTVSVEEALGDTGKAAPAMASDDFDKRWGIGATDSAAPTQSSTDDFDKRWGIKPDAKTAAAPGSTGDLQGTALAAGLVNGVPIAGPFILSGLEKTGAAANAVLNNSRYSDELAAIQKRTADAEAQHGTASTVGNIAGAVAGSVPMMAAAPGAFGLAGSSMARMMMAGGVTNALVGGTDAAVRGQNPLTGAGFGAVGGGLGPLAGKVVGAGVNKLADAVNGLMPTGVDGMGRASANMLGKVINWDDPAAVRAKLAQLGPDGMLADAGPSLTGLTQGLATEVSPAKSVVTKALEDRAKGAGDRVSAQIQDSLGPAYDPEQVKRGIEQTRKETTGPLYNQAHNNAPPVDAQSVVDEIDNHLKYAEGNQKKALENLRGQIMESKEVPLLNDDGSPVMAPGTSVRNTPRAYDPTKGPAPVSLHDFVRNFGGINDEHGELEHLGLSKLANPKGMSLDDMRRNAAEQGYLGANIDDAMANTYATDLLDKLEGGKGKSVFSVYDQDRLGLKKPTGRDPSNGWSPGEMVAQTETQSAPKTGSRNLHNIRQELDNVIEHDAPGLGVPASAVSRSQDSLVAVRSKLDDVLKSQVPGMSDADAKFAALADRQNALDRGYNKVLGQNSPNPETFAADRAAQDPGVNIAENMGIRGRIDRMFGTGTQRDPAILNKLLTGGGDDKYAVRNLSTAFGDEPINKLVSRLGNEHDMAATNQVVLHGSNTAKLQAGRDLLKETQPASMNFMNSTPSGMAVQGVKSLAVDPLIRMIMENPTAPRNLELARAITAQGPEAVQRFQQALRLNNMQGLISQLGSQVGTAAQGGVNRLLAIGAPAYNAANEPRPLTITRR